MAELVRRVRNTALLLFVVAAIGFGSAAPLQAMDPTICNPNVGYDPDYVEFTANSCDFWEIDPCSDGGWTLCAASCDYFHSSWGQPYTACSSSGNGDYFWLIYLYCTCG